MYIPSIMTNLFAKSTVSRVAITVVSLGLTSYAEDEHNKEVETMLKIGVPEKADEKSSTKDTGPGLPRVLLIGDSISGGYIGPVQTHLKGVAVVQRGQNGGPTTKGLEILDDILGEEPWDVIHFNWGLHDMTWQFRMKPEERGVEAYQARLEQLVQRLKNTKAQLIWATTTPWPDNYAYFEKRFGRKLLYSAEEEKKWQDAALSVMKKHGIPVNDLYALLKPDLDKYQKTEDVHFTGEGNKAMGRQIADTVRRYLKPAPEDVTKATLRPLAPPPGEDVPREPTEREYLERAKAGAVAHRQVDAELTFLDQHGKPLRGAVVSVRQKRHAFLFGCIGFDLVPNLSLGHIKSNPPKTPEDLALWKKRFSTLFNFTTLPFYWRSYEKAPGKPEHRDMDAALAWFREEGITVKGHPLIWTHKDGRPSWYGDKAFADVNLLTGETVASELEKDADLAVSWRELVLHRVRREVGQFAGQIDIWDIYNEAAFKRKGNALKTAPLIHDACCAAKEANPQAKLILNDAGMFSDDDRRDGLYRLLLELKRLGTPLGGLGFQAHIPDNGWWIPERMIDTLDQFAELGWPIHITEFIPRANGARIRGGWRSGEWTAELQADCAEFFYRLWFGHPAVASINWWGLSDRSIWLGNGGLIDEQYNPKPVYKRLDALINDEWRTVLDVKTDDLGRIRFRGFKGDYELNVQLPDGTEQTFTTALAGGTQHQETFRSLE